jgi:hypothetical protein
MESEFSWLVLVLAFAATTVGCGFLLARLWRIASQGGGAAGSGAEDRPAERPSR